MKNKYKNMKGLEQLKVENIDNKDIIIINENLRELF